MITVGEGHQLPTVEQICRPFLEGIELLHDLANVEPACWPEASSNKPMFARVAEINVTMNRAIDLIVAWPGAHTSGDVDDEVSKRFRFVPETLCEVDGPRWTNYHVCEQILGREVSIAPPVSGIGSAA